MDVLWQELSFGMADGRQLAVVIIRLLAATLMGAAIGFEREQAGKSAGLRTHILVTLGSTIFVLSGSAFGMTSEGLSRVIQGITTGIGFIGAGTILKLSDEGYVKGLTTSAGIWMAAAIGVTIGLGAIGLALVATLLTVVILSVTLSLEKKISSSQHAEKTNHIDKKSAGQD